MTRTLILLLATLLVRDVFADDTLCINGIRTAVTAFVFSDAVGDYWIDLCNGNSTTISMWAAAKLYCSSAEIDAGSVLLDNYCLEYGNIPLTTFAATKPLLTDVYIAHMEIVEFADIAHAKVYNHSVLISKTLWKNSERTVDVFDQSYLTHANLGWGVYAFWGTLLLLGILVRFGTFIAQYRRGNRSKDVEESTRSALPSRKPSTITKWATAPASWIKANLVIPAAFGSHHQRLLWWCNVPTRMELLIITAYWGLSIILCSVSYEIFEDNLYYTIALQDLRYIADRTGIMSYANLPVLWMFSGRNNIFLWATGWSFSTFNIFHRHVARIATIQAIIHSVCYSALEANYGEFLESWTEQYWYMGGLATVAMSLLLVFSSVFLRQRCYEVFIIIHVVLSIATIVGLFYHTTIFDGAYNPYLWPLVAIWVFDRAARIVRLVYCNIHLKLSRGILHTTSTATYSKEADLIRLEVIPGSEFLKPKPNQHYFLYQPLSWRGWENHPFTLASWTTIDDNINQKDSVALTNQASSHSKTVADIDITPDSLSSSSAEVQSTESSNSIQSSTHGRFKLVFFVRPFDGWTKRLRNDCIAHPSEPLQTRILLEGPYGETAPLHHYENVIFIAGGTGISGAIPYLEDHIIRAAAGTTATQNITLLWTTRQSSMVHDLCAAELAPVLGREDVTVSFHATARKEVKAVVEAHAVVLQTKTIKDMPETFPIGYGRPNVRGLVLNTVETVRAAGIRGGRIAVLVCGPAGMADEARSAVHMALKSGAGGVDYLEETFGW